MSDRTTHVTVGVGVGALAAYCASHDQLDSQRSLEVLGGCLGGYWGARLPDVIDPATHPDHRHIGHGALTAAGVGLVCWRNLPVQQQALRARADSLRFKAAFARDGFSKLLWQLGECALRVSAGALPALMAGYASHLALDSTTPMGIPIIKRGF
jgi:hypothetical protein